MILHKKQKEKDMKTKEELAVLERALVDIMAKTVEAFCEGDPEKASEVEPLEQVIDQLKEQMRAHHIIRLQQGDCSIEAGFVWNDLLTNLERVSDHCFNISLCMLETQDENMNLHQYRREAHESQNATYDELLKGYTEKYSLAPAKVGQ